jgi:hypothetical protein
VPGSGSSFPVWAELLVTVPLSRKESDVVTGGLTACAGAGSVENVSTNAAAAARGAQGLGGECPQWASCTSEYMPHKPLPCAA